MSINAFLFLCCINPTALWAAAPADIQVDQTGYLTNETKLAMVTNASATGTFYVVNTSGPTTALTGTLSGAVVDTNTGLSVQTANFSSVTTTGNYYLYVAGVGQSYGFAIGPNVFSNAFYETMRFYTGQRCGTPLTIINAGTTWTHGLCHAPGAADGESDGTFDSSSGTSGFKSSTKGWHDAGDYGKYIVNANISVGELLWTYEWYSSVLSSYNLNLPESGNGTPDVLNECKWELDWMLTMQDTDGGVWAKLTSAGFPSFVLPENDDAGTRLIIGTNNGSPYKDSGATAGFAAVMAIAARLYQPYNAAYATTCLNAAVSAWSWVNTNPNSNTTGNPAGISTGSYSDGGSSTPSYRLWAAAELYRTTGTAAYQTYFTSNYASTPDGATLLKATEYPQDWTNTKNLAFWCYYFTGKNGIQTVNVGVTTAIYNATLNTADAVTARQATDGYRVSLETSDYIWGSNGGVGNYGILLLMANAMSPNVNYVQCAEDDIHYLLGRNGNKQSFVTDLGTLFQMHPHHRPSAADSVVLPWPGMLAGGPNKGGGDGITPTGNPPALCYTDTQGAYASNEEAINWNAPLVFVLASTLESTGATPTPTSTGTNTSTATATSTATRTATATATSSATLTATSSATRTATSTATFSPTATVTPTPTLTPTFTLTFTPSFTTTTTPTFSSSFTTTVTASITPTATPSFTYTTTPTASFTSTATNSPTGTLSPTNSPTITNTLTKTPTPSLTSTASSTYSTTPTSSFTLTTTYTPTATASSTATTTPTSSSTSTATNSPTGTLTPTNSPTKTPTPSFTSTALATLSNTPTSTGTASFTPTLTHTPSFTSTMTVTETLTWTPTSTPTATGSFTHTSTSTPSMTPTGSVPGVIVSNPYPNPSYFGTPVKVDIQVPSPAAVKWAVFTTAFRKINSGEFSLADTTTFQWNLKDKAGAEAARGLYYFRLEVSGSFGGVKKIFKILVL